MTITTTTTTVWVIWTGSIGHEPSIDLAEQKHVFQHGNTKSARRTTLARLRRWHGEITVLAVLVNADDATIERKSEEVSSGFTLCIS